MILGVQMSLCPYCDVYYSVNNIKEHLRRHLGTKAFKCGQCDYACTHKSTMQQHMRTCKHTKPYHCAQCGRAVKSMQILRKHMRTVHNKQQLHVRTQVIMNYFVCSIYYVHFILCFQAIDDDEHFAALDDKAKSKPSKVVTRRSSRKTAGAGTGVTTTDILAAVPNGFEMALDLELMVSNFVMFNIYNSIF